VLDRCEHGYSQAARGQGWPALIDRFLGRHRDIDALTGALHVSAVSAADGGAAHAAACDQFGDALASIYRTGQTRHTRPIFGDARSVNAMYGVALAAQHLATRRTGTALASSLSNRGAYALFSLSAA
jgi:hypothetical protein